MSLSYYKIDGCIMQLSFEMFHKYI